MGNAQRVSWDVVSKHTSSALLQGALHPISTNYIVLEERGVPFTVHYLSEAHRRKVAEMPSSPQGRRDNPFLPPEPELLVGEVSATHWVVLNKYPVIMNHILLTTKEFVAQESWLDSADFVALWRALSQCPGLAFYNGGSSAGASQPHRHWQLVPSAEFPLLALWDSAEFSGEIGRVAALPFRHALLKVSPDWLASPEQYGETSCEKIDLLYAAVGMDRSRPMAPPYNLLITPSYLMLIPRSKEHWQEMSINALGFAGSLFVKNERQLANLRENGIFNSLQEVASF